MALAFASLAHAAGEKARETLDSVKTTLSEVDDVLKLDALTDRDLANLRARIDPLAGELQGVISDLTPRLDASRKRLAELKPKGQEPIAQSDPAAAELKAEQTKFDGLDADLRSARAALLQVDDYVARIGARRREIFARATFARSASVLSPLLWLAVAREAPRDFDTFRGVVAGAAKRLAARATFGQIAGFLGVLAALLALAAPLLWIARRVIPLGANGQTPGRLRKALVGVWTLAVLAGLPLIGLQALAYSIDLFDISDPALQGVVNAALDGLRLIALANAFAQAVLAPRREAWRMPRLGEEAAATLSRLILANALVWSLARFVEAIAASAQSYNLLVLTRGVSAVAIAALCAFAFRRLAHSADAAAPSRDSGRPLRTLAWAYLAAIVACASAGYIALATYLVEHAAQVLAAISALYLLDALAQEALQRLLKPESKAAQDAMATLGLRRSGLEQIVVLAQGVSRLAAIVAALVVAVGPLGLPSQDLWASLRAAYFGVSVGGVTLSISSLVAAAVAFVLILAATRAAQNWLAERYLPRTGLDAGVKNSIRTIFGYVGVVAALIAAGSRLGVDTDRLAWVAGGLSVGIGFGLQGIANNFVAGLILLWERGIRVGDWVVVGQDQGFVRRINARSTEIETFERATLIVPNLMFVTGTVKNWLHTDRVGQLTLNVNAAFESDPEVVRALLIEAARAQEAVLAIPAPLALFSDIGDWAMRFQLIVYVEDALLAARVKSELNFDIMQRMRAAGLRIPYPFPVANVESERGPNASRIA
jgi:small-conductance mechanosensitive channel